MTCPKIGDWIVKSIDANDPEPYLSDPEWEDAIWGHKQAEAHPFVSAAAAHEARHKIGGEALRVFRLVPKKQAEWGDNHALEARAALYRLAAGWAAKGHRATAHAIAYAVWQYDYNTATEPGFMRVLLKAAHLDKAEARAVIRTVRALAEKRIDVKEETFFRVRLRDGLYVPEHGDDDTAGVGAKDARQRENGTHMDQTAARIPGARVVTVKLKRHRTLRKAAA